MAEIITAEEYFRARSYAEAGVPQKFLHKKKLQLKPSGIGDKIYEAASEKRAVLVFGGVAAKEAGLYVAERKLRETIDTDRPVRVKRFSLFNLFNCYREMTKNQEYQRVISSLFGYGELLVVSDFLSEVRAVWQENDRRWLQQKLRQARTEQGAILAVCCGPTLQLKDVADFFYVDRDRIKPFLIKAAREIDCVKD